jgi:hypothetical protein
VCVQWPEDGIGKATKDPILCSPCTGRHCTMASPPDTRHYHHRLGKLTAHGSDGNGDTLCDAVPPKWGGWSPED